ncbi:MAG: dihydroxyacetone kinase subunit DhaK [Bowdeniella nasicola]|nr:dihydroxyacetone kinase subunit DhaK [Bowdeniella nasicola]
MTHLHNNPADFVTEYLTGLQLAHPDLVVAKVQDPGPYVTRADHHDGEVALISGGGAGHEPLHAGFVGPGMLHGAVPGPIFTSPPPDPILAAIRAVDTGAGVVLIVKNYTGDVMNFEIAAELAAAEGITCHHVLIADDVAVADSTYTAGRRGVAGTMLVEKIAGAAAARGDDIHAVTQLATHAAQRVFSMGVATQAGSRPGGDETFHLPANAMEMGIGIHGEPGRAQLPIASADAQVEQLVDQIVCELPADANELLVFVNGMGATTSAELYLCYRAAHEQLSARGYTIERSLVGSYVTSLDMHGVQLSVMALDERLRDAWDAPCRTPAYTHVG